MTNYALYLYTCTWVFPSLIVLKKAALSIFGGGILIGIGEKEKFKSLGVISNYTPYLWCKAQLYLNYKKKLERSLRIKKNNTWMVTYIICIWNYGLLSHNNIY